MLTKMTRMPGFRILEKWCAIQAENAANIGNIQGVAGPGGTKDPNAVFIAYHTQATKASIYSGLCNNIKMVSAKNEPKGG